MDDMHGSFSDDLESSLKGVPVISPTENNFPGLETSAHCESTDSCDSFSSHSLQEDDVLHTRVKLSESASVFTDSMSPEVPRPSSSQSISTPELNDSDKPPSHKSSTGSALPPTPDLVAQQPSIQPATPPSLDIQSFVL